MNNNLYLKYYLLLLTTLNTINVSSFNLVGYFPRNNRIVNCSLRNLRMCSSSYLDNLNNDIEQSAYNKLKNLTLSPNDIESNNILLNNLYNMYRFK
jgi:hypothetical protein